MSYLNKSKAMQDLCDNMALNIYGTKLSCALEDNICVSCKKPQFGLTPADEKEYRISGLCPSCWKASVGDNL